MPKPAKIKIGDDVWLRGIQVKGKVVDPFELATITNVQQDGARLTAKRGGGAEETLDTAKADVFPANEKGMMTNDHCALIHLNEPCVLENTRLRFTNDKIYTYTGKILVALNPFGPLDIYGDAKMKNYIDKDIGAKGCDPHVYAMGEAAFKHVKRFKTPAALIMSGESGAGKTETTKHLMRYLAWRSDAASGKAGSGDKLDALADAILSTNPLLESFGNAKTVRNNNSSRFGKMMRLHFNSSGAVAGAYIKTYLLEKSRVVTVTNPERSYHIFYQVLVSSYDVKGPALSKLEAKDCKMLNGSQCFTLTKMSDTDFHKEVTDSFAKLAVPAQSSKELIQVLSALLLLGNVSFVDDDSEKAKITNGDVLAASEALFGSGEITGLLTTKTVQRGGGNKRASVTVISYNKTKAEMSRDAVIKSVYTHLFDWIVSLVNGFLLSDPEATKLPYVGLLDIFGFENFKHNSFEQLCINFCNEKLQQFFLTCVFKEEENLHIKEGVPWKDIEYADNQGGINMVEKPPNGMLRLLDSHCKAPSPSEQNFCKEVNKVHTATKPSYLVPTRKHKMMDEEGFIVAHYAGDVVYHTAAMIGKSTGNAEVSWLDKNNDSLDPAWAARFASAEVALLKTMFAEEHEKASKDKKGSSFSSVGKRFVNELNSLVTELQSSKASFIRCVKPNAAQATKEFTQAMVLDQLRCSGVIEAVRVMLEAFPTRIDYEDIHGRYAPLMGKEIMAETGDEPAAFCEAIALACEVNPSDYALGVSKLFLKAGSGTFLEDLAAMDPAVVVPLLTEKIAQAKRRKGAGSLIGSSVLGWYRRKQYKEKKRAAEIAQHRIRTVKARREYAKWSKEREARLKMEAEENVKKMAADKAAAEAAAKLKKEQEAAMKAAAGATAMQQEKLKKEQEAAMAAAVAKATADAEASLAAGMAAAEKAVEASAERDRDKHGLELARNAAETEGGYAPAQVEKGGARRKSVERGKSTSAFSIPTKNAAAKEVEDKAAAEAAKAAEEKIEEESIEVTLDRGKPGGTLGIAIDLWDGEVTIGTVVTNGPADSEGSLVQGDIIRGVDGVKCGSIEEVTMNVMKAGQKIKLTCARRPVKTVLESSLKMKMPSGEFEPFSFQLLSNRVVKFDKLSPPQYSGEIHARTAQSLELKEDKGDKLLSIETGHKAFELKGQSKKDLARWHLRLQEVIMLAEKVSNIAAGWLLKEELGGGSDGRDKQLKNYYFVLFSNGILMRFTDEKSAKLGQAIGFIDVVDIKEQSVSAKQHTVRLKCSFDEWVLAATNKENMAQWATSLKANKRSKTVSKPTQEMILGQGWIDLPKEGDSKRVSEAEEEEFVRHWFMLKNSVLAFYTEKEKLTASLSTPVVQLQTSDMKTAYRPNGTEFYKWAIELETTNGSIFRMRAPGESEMRQLLSNLNVHCIEGGKAEEVKPKVTTKKEVVRAGYLFKKSLKTGGIVRVGKAWQRYFFLLEVESKTGADGNVTSVATFTCADAPKDEKSLVTLPLHEATGVKVAIGKTKGTERRITLTTPSRDFELGTDDKDLADGWHDDLQAWMGGPKTESAAAMAKASEVLRSQWMEARVEVFELEDISEEELARSNTIQQTAGAFARTFTLTGGSKKPEPAAAKKPVEESDDDDDEDDEDKDTFSWVFVALLSDGTLRQYKDEKMTEEVARMKLGKKVQADLLDDPPDTYEHAFRVKPESAHADSWILCPDSFVETEEWIAELKHE